MTVLGFMPEGDYFTDIGKILFCTRLLPEENWERYKISLPGCRNLPNGYLILNLIWRNFI